MKLLSEEMKATLRKSWGIQHPHTHPGKNPGADLNKKTTYWALRKQAQARRAAFAVPNIIERIFTDIRSNA
jgi:hypothetical protein